MATRQYGSLIVEVEWKLKLGWVWRCLPRFPEWSKRGHAQQADAYQMAWFAILEPDE
jgi:hypothetical protein